jgi:hypothetical protein
VDAPVGDVTITVTVPNTQTMMMGGNKPKVPGGGTTMKGAPPEMVPTGPGIGDIDPKRIPSLPAKYTTAAKSPLKFKVEEGSQEYDIKLTK